MIQYPDIVQGGDEDIVVVLTDSSGWPVGSDVWTWSLLLGLRETRAVLGVAIASTTSVISTVTVANDTMTLLFDFTPVITAALSLGVYYVECEGDNAGVEHYYNAAQGEMTVREPEGGG